MTRSDERGMVNGQVRRYFFTSRNSGESVARVTWAPHKKSSMAGHISLWFNAENKREKKMKMTRGTFNIS